MSIGVLRRHTRAQLDSLQRLLDTPRIEGPSPLTPEDYQDLLTLVLEFPASYQRAVTAELRRVFTDRSRSIVQLQQVRAELTDMGNRYLSMVRLVQQDATLEVLAGRQPHLQSALGQLAEAMDMLQGEQRRLVADWPVASPEEMADVPAQIERGEFLPVDQVFAELKGISTDQLHRQLGGAQSQTEEVRLGVTAMPYTTLIGPEASRQIQAWGLSEPVWMEVLLRLYQVLAQDPPAHLTSLPDLPGMLYYFNFPDPERTDFIHEFVFQVQYLADEQHVLVLRGSYWRHAGGLPERE